MTTWEVEMMKGEMGQNIIEIVRKLKVPLTLLKMEYWKLTWKGSGRCRNRFEN